MRRGGRAPRGRIRAEILRLLLDGPKHGYELMNLIAEQSGGAWQPSPGSIYPTLQLLEDQGLVASASDGDRRVYQLTDAGREEAERLQHEPGPHAGPAGARLGPEIAQVMGALRTIAMSGTPEQRDAAQSAIAEFRRTLYQILAQ
ncbi:PadR family transcriptional regulator [Acidimicrobium ferrooxidans]|nr:PadR family transcriptional regulator [Acidimicrobium ferrooxidans]